VYQKGWAITACLSSYDVTSMGPLIWAKFRYLEPDVNDFMNQLADEKGVDIQQLVNEWLRVNIKLIKSVNAEETGQSASPTP